MFNNKVIYVSSEEAEKISTSLSETIYTVHMDGKSICSEGDYLRQAWVKFKFPYPDEEPGWDNYIDRIRDLSWIEADGFALFVHDFSMFMNDSIESKTLFVASFVGFILPFWEDEVTKVFAEGKAKPFNVYLVD